MYCKKVDIEKMLGSRKGGRNEVAQFGPLQKKTFASALHQFFEEQSPQMGG